MTAVEVAEPAWRNAVAQVEALVRTAAAATLGQMAPADEDAEIAVLLTDDAAVAELNGRFRARPEPTNVLSFPAAAGVDGHLGDIALAYGVCAREALAQDKPLAHHLQHLVAHGVLHLLGYDHVNDAEADEMEALERVILAGLGVPDPYGGERGDDG